MIKQLKQKERGKSKTIGPIGLVMVRAARSWKERELTVAVAIDMMPQTVAVE